MAAASSITVSSASSTGESAQGAGATQNLPAKADWNLPESSERPAEVSFEQNQEATSHTDGSPLRTAETLAWRVHPARERPGAALAALAVIAAFAGLAAVLMQCAGWGGLAAVLMLAPMSRFFLPSAYRIDAEGASTRHLGRRRMCYWTEVRRFTHGGRGAFLSTRARASLLDGWRGLHLLFAGNRGEVVAMVERHMAAARRREGEVRDEPHADNAATGRRIAEKGATRCAG